MRISSCRRYSSSRTWRSTVFISVSRTWERGTVYTCVSIAPEGGVPYSPVLLAEKGTLPTFSFFPGVQVPFETKGKSQLCLSGIPSLDAQMQHKWHVFTRVNTVRAGTDEHVCGHTGCFIRLSGVFLQTDSAHNLNKFTSFHKGNDLVRVL